LIIHNRSSANPENLAKIGPVHNWILRQLVWPESLKTNTKQKQNTLPAGLLSAAGRAKNRILSVDGTDADDLISRSNLRRRPWGIDR